MKRRAKGLCVLAVLIGVLVWLVRREPAKEPDTFSAGDACWSQAGNWCLAPGGWCDLPATPSGEGGWEAWRRAHSECWKTCLQPYMNRCLRHRAMSGVVTEEENDRLLDGIRALQASWQK
jgi:hypothetical protein